VRTIIPSADRQKATVKVRITFDQLDPRILPDMGVKVTFLGDEPSQKQAAAILVPAEVVRDENGKKVVFVYKNGKAERRAVGIGGARGNSQEILAGLTEGDQVIVKPLDQLRDGESVDIKK
jgi:multidrug efflux pump subunit AcrA (membrane-fusion protein)